MGITAKEIAKELGLSPSAVSLALNNKPGVSQQTRELILSFAEKNGFKHKIKEMTNRKLSILFIIYQEYAVALDYYHISIEMIDGISDICQQNNYILRTTKIDSDEESLQRFICDLRVDPVDGLLVLGTSMSKRVINEFISLGIPIVLIDTPIDTVNCSRVCINNVQGAYTATDYLIKYRHCQPGYLCSNIRLPNFEERKSGFKQAIQDNGLSFSQSIIHELSPSIDGAFSDFMSLLEKEITLADCYFADNDLIAIGVIKALTTKGYRVPEDVGVIGFDNINICHVFQPSLSSVAFSRNYLGQVATNHLISIIKNRKQPNQKIQIDTRLVKRLSV